MGEKPDPLIGIKGPHATGSGGANHKIWGIGEPGNRRKGKGSRPNRIRYRSGNIWKFGFSFGRIQEKYKKKSNKNRKNLKYVRTLFYVGVNVSGASGTCAKWTQKRENTTYCACKKRKKRVYFALFEKGHFFLIAVREGDFPGMTGTGSKLWGTLLLLMLAGCVFIAAAGGAGEACPLLGDWAFNYEPAVSVLTVAEDGTAVWNGAECTWEDDGTFLTLTGEEETVTLRYLADEEKVLLFLPASYTRTAKDRDDEIFGAWIQDGASRSSFVFDKSMQFLEDETFVGYFEVDDEAGTFTLRYQPSYFDDTTCYFVRDGDHMTVEYPWTIVETQAEEAGEAAEQ